MRLEKAISNDEPFVALNFWGYAGIAKNNPKDGKWKIGVDFTTDPPQEPQGLNSIFSSETSTMDLIKVYKEKSLVLGKQVAFLDKNIAYTGIASEITDQGHLIVTLDDGQEKVLRSGEISLSSW